MPYDDDILGANCTMERLHDVPIGDEGSLRVGDIKMMRAAERSPHR